MIPSMRKTVVEGLRLIDRIPEVSNRAGTSDRILELKGANFNIPISRTILSQHILFTGGIGTGKTNAIFQIVDQLVRFWKKYSPTMIAWEEVAFQRVYMKLLQEMLLPQGIALPLVPISAKGSKETRATALRC